MRVASVTERGREAVAGAGGDGARRHEEARQAIQLVTVAAALGIAWWLKSFYSRATFDELRWLLDPTVRLAEMLGSGWFELEAHAGWLSRARNFAVVPACAGMNFLIASFLSLAVGLASRCRDGWGAAAALLASAVAAYGTTLIANALRIALAVRLHAADDRIGPFTADQLHELLGICVYFLSLLALFAVAMRIAGSTDEPAH